MRETPPDSSIRCLVALLTAILLTGSACTPSRSPAGEIGKLFNDLHARGLFNGAVVVRDDDSVYEGGFGPANRDEGITFTVDTPSDGGSMAKTFTAAAILLLEADGILDLDDAVVRYLPELPYESIRVRHLITHTSGLPGYDFFESHLPPDELLSNDFWLETLALHAPELAFTPGTEFEYSDQGFDLAAAIVEVATGGTYEQYLRQRFFTPLEMHGAFVRPARFEEWQEPRTKSYRNHDGMLQEYPIWEEAFYGGSNVYFSARDLDRWSLSFLRRALLPPKATDLVILTGGGATGINLSSWYYASDQTRYWYTGQLRGFYSMAYRDVTKGRSIAFVTNNAPPVWLRPLFVPAIERLLDGGLFSPIREPPRLSLVASSLPSLLGDYDVEGLGRLELIAEGGTLDDDEVPVARARVDGGPWFAVFSVGADTLFVPAVDAWISFLPPRSEADDPGLAWVTPALRTRGTRIDEPHR